MLSLSQKKQLTDEVQKQADSATGMLVAEYRGLKVSQITSLRQKARKDRVIIRVVKNSLARRALSKTRYACLDKALSGPVILAMCQDNPGSAAKLFSNFAKDCDMLKVTALSLGGSLLAANELDRVANLPTHEQALSGLMATMSAPLAKLVRTLNEIPVKVTRVISAVKDQKSKL